MRVLIGSDQNLIPKMPPVGMSFNSIRTNCLESNSLSDGKTLLTFSIPFIQSEQTHVFDWFQQRRKLSQNDPCP
jgi:hypothetical protein